jgi:hypothetical protein
VEVEEGVVKVVVMGSVVVVVVGSGEDNAESGSSSSGHSLIMHTCPPSMIKTQVDKAKLWLCTQLHTLS